MGDETGPPWGALAVEQYFITKWDYSSTETPNQQRKRLVFEFLNLNLIPLEWVEAWDGLPGGIDPPRAPTAEEIDTILRPYRIDALRWRADNMFDDQTSPVLLRTYYSTDEGERAKHDDLIYHWVDPSPFDAEAWWAVLDDANHFNFGSDWRRVYEILPEVAGPLSIDVDDDFCIPRVHGPDYCDHARPDFKAQIAEAKEEDPKAWHEDRDGVIEACALRLHSLTTRTYLLIADEEAFRSNSLLLLYLDGFRNIVREARLDPEIDDIFGVVGLWMDGELLRTSVVGEKYRVGGELGKELYQLTEEDLADPK